MIPIKDFLPDEEQIGLLRRLLPEDESVFSLLKRQHKKAKRKEICNERKTSRIRK